MRARLLSTSLLLLLLGALPAVAQTCKSAIPDSDLVTAGKLQMSINPTLPPQQFVDEKEFSDKELMQHCATAEENVEDFRRRMLEYASERLTPADFVEEIEVDSVLEFDEVTDG